jgi:hypothetical protein
MIAWLLGINLRAVLITTGAGFITIILLLLFIAYKVEEIEKKDESHK